MQKYIAPVAALGISLVITVVLTQMVKPAKAESVDFEPIQYQEKSGNSMGQHRGGSCS